MKKWVAIILALVLVGGGVFWATQRHYANKRVVEVVEKEVPVEREVLVEVEKKTEITGEILREGLRDIGQLATEEYSYTEVGTYDSAKQIKGFNVPFTQSRFIYSYDGTIKAGVDFDEITVEKDDEGKRITVTLPKAHILSSELDEDSFQLYDEKNSIFNPFSVSNVNSTNKELKRNAEDKAVAKGLLERADGNAKTLIRGFLQSSFDLSDYTVEIKNA